MKDLLGQAIGGCLGTILAVALVATLMALGWWPQ